MIGYSVKAFALGAALLYCAATLTEGAGDKVALCRSASQATTDMGIGIRVDTSCVNGVDGCINDHCRMCQVYYTAYSENLLPCSASVTLPAPVAIGSAPVGWWSAGAATTTTPAVVKPAVTPAPAPADDEGEFGDDEFGDDGTNDNTGGGDEFGDDDGTGGGDEFSDDDGTGGDGTGGGDDFDGEDGFRGGGEGTGDDGFGAGGEGTGDDEFGTGGEGTGDDEFGTGGEGTGDGTGDENTDFDWRRRLGASARLRAVEA